MPNGLAESRILVTGGSGFLGRHLIPMLLEAGAKVSCIIRSNPERLPAKVRIIHGDVCDPGVVNSACLGQDIIIHMAGKLFGSQWDEYLEANCQMARNIANAARGCKIVFVSSLAAAGPSAEPRAENETPTPVSAYGWSKLLAEQVLLGMNKDTAVLRPPIIYGSGDKGLLPLFKSCSRGLGITSGSFPVSLIHAHDCARAILRICARDASGIYQVEDGQIYNIGELCRAMGRACGRKRVFVAQAPKWLLAMSASFSTGLHKVISDCARLGRFPKPAPPLWNRDKFREAVQAGWVADSTRLRSELGYKPLISLADGMAETVAGYRKDGWI